VPCLTSVLREFLAWISRAAGFGQAWVSLVRAGVIEPLEASQLQRYERLLKRIRAWLHILAGRREDRPIFVLQPAAAQAILLPGGAARRRHGRLAPERAALRHAAQHHEGQEEAAGKTVAGRTGCRSGAAPEGAEGDRAARAPGRREGGQRG